MPFTNIHYGARISPSKARLVVDLIRGKTLGEAMTILELSKNRGAMFVRRCLEAAQANADQAEADTRRLYVSDARVDSGPTMKRFQPKDRGRAHSILKRTSHITISVDDLASKPRVRSSRAKNRKPRTVRAATATSKG